MADLCESISIHKPLRDVHESAEICTKPTIGDRISGNAQAIVGRLTNDHTKIMRGHAISHGIVRTEREREIEHERSRQARTTERPCANHHSKRTSPPEAASHPTERGTEGSEAEGGEAPADGSTSPSTRRPPIDPHSPVNTFLSKDVLTPASSGAIAEGDRA